MLGRPHIHMVPIGVHHPQMWNFNFVSTARNWREFVWLHVEPYKMRPSPNWSVDWQTPSGSSLTTCRPAKLIRTLEVEFVIWSLAARMAMVCTPRKRDSKIKWTGICHEFSRIRICLFCSSYNWCFYLGCRDLSRLEEAIAIDLGRNSWNPQPLDLRRGPLEVHWGHEWL
jgi:hypothetical protein